MRKVINKIMSCLGYVPRAEVLRQSIILDNSMRPREEDENKVHDHVMEGALGVGASQEQADYKGSLARSYYNVGLMIGSSAHRNALNQWLDPDGKEEMR